MSTIQHSQTLTSMTCGCVGCGIAFAIPESLYRRANEDHDVRFYCPNGHRVGYSGKTDVEKARAEAAQLERRLANAQEDARAAHASLVATKGHLTRMRRRIANGVCPCCTRSFSNVRRHMASQHPDVLAKLDESTS